VTELQVDRLRELASIGAGHAASAFAGLAGRPVRMGLPRVRPMEEPGAESARPGVGTTGIYFEMDGCLGALVAILLRTPECEAVVRCLAGESAGPPTPETIRSVLAEVGNILASHVASAIADTLGGRLLPSVPSLVMGDADRELARRSGDRAGPHPIRIECELRDGRGEVGGLLVVVPDVQPGPSDEAVPARSGG